MSSSLYNGLTLAYIGDAYYELLVRMYLVEKGYGKVNELHNKAIKFTSGSQQAKFILKMIEDNFLTEEEIEVFKKGRNCHTNQNRKNIELQVYQKATGFEALIGALYIDKKLDRIEEIFDYIMNYLNTEVEHGKK